LEDLFKKLATQLLDFAKSLSAKTKVAIIAGTAGLVLVIAIIVMLMNNVSYTLLYQGLDPAEAGQITDALTQLAVPYKIQGTGTIMVDTKQVDTAKMKLAEQGYPKSTLTYDTFMKGTNWAMTDSDKQKLSLYQTQDRLQDTIKTITGVRTVEVNIALQDSNSYVLSSDKAPTTASVKLNLVLGADLTQQQVNGIVQLVSHSVPDLAAANVTVLDSDGSPLTQDNNDTSTNGGNSKVELENKIAAQVKTKVLSILESLYGTGKVKVAAGVILDNSQTLINKTTTISTSSNASSSTTSSATNSAGGTSSTTSTTSGTTSTASNTSNPQTNNMVDTINQQIQDNGGKVSKLTIAVVIDTKAAATADVTALKNTVAFATGIDQTGVYVQLAPFAIIATSVATTPPTSLPISTQNLLLIGAIVLTVLALVAVLLFVLKRGKRNASPNLKAKGKTNEITGEKQKGAVPAQINAKLDELDERSLEEILNDPSASNTRKQIETFAEKKPELVAQLLRNWLKD
jgi:flagellar M-ring protein FliF